MERGWCIFEKLKEAMDRAGCACLSKPFYFLHVSIERQKIYHCCGSEILCTYPITTGKMPPCNLENSAGTPIGLHRICEKYGDGVLPGVVFIGRVSTGEHFSKYADWKSRNYVVTRILRLEGLEEGNNRGKNIGGISCDTWKRMIYIHGIAKDANIGRPTSGGCVGMLSGDIVELYEKVNRQILINIVLE
ncbi:MAG: L,D-transpeptidase [Puniceicoccales bacterium]|jgi:hypothetical protein|nr:L,D-transpeptidase [Puniceicoccales bacterium]